MATVFISYRRSDSQDVTGRIYDRLVNRYTPRCVFKDVNSIPPGVSFPLHIRNRLQKTDVMLVVIGRSWLHCMDEHGKRRLHDPHDFVRLEVEQALCSKMPVIPVLVADAPMPQVAQLPPSLQRLASRHAIPVRHDPDFNNDVARLLGWLDRLDESLGGRSHHEGGSDADDGAREPHRPSRRLPSQFSPLTIGLTLLGVAMLAVLFLGCLGMAMSDSPRTDVVVADAPGTSVEVVDFLGNDELREDVTLKIGGRTESFAIIRPNMTRQSINFSLPPGVHEFTADGVSVRVVPDVGTVTLEGHGQGKIDTRGGRRYRFLQVLQEDGATYRIDLVPNEN